MTWVRRSPGLLWLLLAAALFMRAVVPQGFMAEADAAGSVTVKVCGAGHLVEIPVGEDESPRGGPRAQQPCAFAGLGAPALPPPPSGELAVPGIVAIAYGSPPTVFPHAVSAPHRPPVRGPPLAA